MPSNREAESLSWQLARTAWDVLRSAGGWARRQGRAVEAEALMADARSALEEVASRHVLVGEYRRSAAGQAYLRAKAHARAHVTSARGGHR